MISVMEIGKEGMVIENWSPDKLHRLVSTRTHGAAEASGAKAASYASIEVDVKSCSGIRNRQFGEYDAVQSYG